MLAARVPRSVSAVVGRIEAWYDGEDQANVTVQFESGAVAHLDQSWCMRTPRDSLAIFGTEGQAIVDDLEGTTLDVQIGKASERIEVAPRSSATHRPVVEHGARAAVGRHSALLGRRRGPVEPDHRACLSCRQRTPDARCVGISGHTLDSCHTDDDVTLIRRVQEHRQPNGDQSDATDSMTTGRAVPTDDTWACTQRRDDSWRGSVD